MQKIKFDFEATKERIYAPNSNVPIGAPVDRNGNIANDGNAYGIVLCKETENKKYWVRYNLVVMVAGYVDIIDAQAIWCDEYSAEAIAAMSDITFCDNHELPTGGGGGGDDYPLPLIASANITEDVANVEFTKDVNGNNLQIKQEFYVEVEVKLPATPSARYSLQFNGGTATENINGSTTSSYFIYGHFTCFSEKRWQGYLVTKERQYYTPTSIGNSCGGVSFQNWLGYNNLPVVISDFKLNLSLGNGSKVKVYGR